MSTLLVDAIPFNVLHKSKPVILHFCSLYNANVILSFSDNIGNSYCSQQLFTTIKTKTSSAPSAG